MAKAMRSGFPNSGTRMIAVRIAAWAATEMIRARRRMRRSRARCSGVPSTKQPCREPNSFCGLGPGSIDITHLHRKVLRARTEISATPASCGLLKYRRRPAPRSQGCEVRASSLKLDTSPVDKFPTATNAGVRLYVIRGGVEMRRQQQICERSEPGNYLELQRVAGR